MTITLKSETEARLRERAEREGTDVSTIVDALAPAWNGKRESRRKQQKVFSAPLRRVMQEKFACFPKSPLSGDPNIIFPTPERVSLEGVSGRETRRMMYRNGRLVYRIIFTLVDADGDGEEETVRILQIRPATQSTASS